MQELLDTLGIKGPVVLLQMVGFVLLYLLLRRFLFGPVGTMLEERRHEVDAGLKAAEEARQEAVKLREEKDSFLAAAREEGRALTQEIVKEANSARERLLTEGQKEREQLLERGRQMIETERRRAIAELRDEVSDLALRAAHRAVREAMDEDAHRKAIDAFISGLEKPENSESAGETTQ